MRDHPRRMASHAAAIMLIFLVSSLLFSGCDGDDAGGFCGGGTCHIPVPGPGVYQVTWRDGCGTLTNATLTSYNGEELVVNLCQQSSVTLTAVNRSCQLAQPVGCYTVAYINTSGAASSKTVCTNGFSNLVLDNCREITTVTPVPTACGISPSGLVSWWSLDGNANDLRGINNGSISGGAFLPAKVNTGFKSSGQGSRIEVSNSASLNLQQFTISAWIRPEVSSRSSPMAVVWKGDANSGDSTTSSYYLHVTSSMGLNTVGLTVGNGTSRQGLESISTLPTGVFTHVAVTADGMLLKVYIDGRLDNSVAQTVIPYNSPYPLQIGSSAGTAPAFFDGVIDELQIYNRALTASEVTAIFNGFDKGLCRGQIAFQSGGLARKTSLQ